MEFSVYDLLQIDGRSSPTDIMNKCQEYCVRWTLASVRQHLCNTMTTEEASVCANAVWSDGHQYLISMATMLLDPSARQCYDAWLDACKRGTPEVVALTLARMQWFNGTSELFKFSDTMLTCLKNTQNIKSIPLTSTRTSSKRTRTPSKRIQTKPLCRLCQCQFKFDEKYLVAHCDCTTRVGHVECVQSFSSRVGGKCPVCRQKLLERHQISKYLFWNVKEKFKFIA